MAVGASSFRCDFGPDVACHDIVNVPLSSPCTDLRSTGCQQAAYKHEVLGEPLSNDGLLDVRMAVSNDNGVTAHYADARNGRAAFVRNGVSTCAQSEQLRAASGFEWCSNGAIRNGSATTAWDAGNAYVGSGMATSPDGQSVYLYYAGGHFSHAGCTRPSSFVPSLRSQLSLCAVEVGPTNQSFGADWAIGAVRLRRDGWSSVSGGYAFAETDTEPQLLTTAVRVPQCGANQSAVLIANV